MLYSYIITQHIFFLLFTAQPLPLRDLLMHCTISQVGEKIRVEAEIKRAQVPPQYRAEPYEPRQETPEQTTEMPRAATSSKFNQGAIAPNQPEQTTRPRMSDTFNMEAGAHNGDNDQPQRAPSDAPEAEI